MFFNYLCLYEVEVCIYNQVETNILVHCLVLEQKILDDHDTKLIVLFLHNLHICPHHRHRVVYIFIMIKKLNFLNKLRLK